MTGTPGETRLTVADWLRFAGYSLPALPLAIVVFPAYTILPAFYAEHSTIPLTTIGTILIAARIFDAVVDPLIGIWSDNTVSRWGPRKPWIAAGALIAMVSVHQLYVPAPTVGAAYYLGWMLAFYFGYSLIEIAHKAWGTDLARDYVSRSAISTALAFAFSTGNLLFAIIPFLGEGARTYDADALRTAAWAVVLFLPLTVGIAFAAAPRGQPVKSRKTNLAEVARIAIRNRPLLNFIIIYFLTGFGQGIFYGLVFLYVTAVMGLGDSFAYFLLGDALVSLAAVPLWYRLIGALQKHRAWSLGLLIAAAALLAMWLVPAGEHAFGILLALVMVRAFGAAAVFVIPNALLGDVVDYELMRSGANRAGNFHALVSLLTKLSAAVSGGLALILVGAIGFAPGSAPTAATVIGFKAIALGLSAAFLLSSAAMAARFPLGRRRHEIVRRRVLRNALQP